MPKKHSKTDKQHVLCSSRQQSRCICTFPKNNIQIMSKGSASGRGGVENLPGARFCHLCRGMCMHDAQFHGNTRKYSAQDTNVHFLSKISQKLCSEAVPQAERGVENLQGAAVLRPWSGHVDARTPRLMATAAEAVAARHSGYPAHR